MFFLLGDSSNGVLKEIWPQNGGNFWTDEKKQTIPAERLLGVAETF